LLGLSNRVRKSAILQEAVSAIKALKREREEMRRDRDRLQQEVSKLATCLQYSHLGSVAAANAVAMTHGGQAPHQMPHMGSANQLSHLNAQASGGSSTVNGIPASAHTHPPNVQCAPVRPVSTSVDASLPSSDAVLMTTAGQQLLPDRRRVRQFLGADSLIRDAVAGTVDERDGLDRPQGAQTGAGSQRQRIQANRPGRNGQALSAPDRRVDSDRG
jgi:hypothetical protein